MEAMGELMGQNTRADLIKILPTRLGNSGNFHFLVKWEFLFYYFSGENDFGRTHRFLGSEPKCLIQNDRGNRAVISLPAATSGLSLLDFEVVLALI